MDQKTRQRKAAHKARKAPGRDQAAAELVKALKRMPRGAARQTLARVEEHHGRAVLLRVWRDLSRPHPLAGRGALHMFGRTVVG